MTEEDCCIFGKLVDDSTKGVNKKSFFLQQQQQRPKGQTQHAMAPPYH